MSRIVYYSKMFQAVPHLAQVERQLPGTFVSSRRSTISAVRHLYPDFPARLESRWLSLFYDGKRKLREADVIVTGSPYRRVLEPYTAKKCTVFHGTYMMLSKSAFQANAHYDLLCVIGPRMQQMMARFADEIAVNAVPTGFLPFGEFPERSPAQREAVLRDYGLNPEWRTIVYTPSRRGIGSWDLLAQQLLVKTPAEFNLVLRPHPSQSLTPRARDRESFRKVRSMAAQRPGSLVDLTSKPLSDVLSVADLVVSDANSPAEESLFYDVPQLFIETPQFSRETILQLAEQECMHPDDTAQLLTLYDCGPRLFLGSDDCLIAPQLEQAITAGQQYAAARQRYFSWVFGSRDRQAGKRVAEAIQTYLIK
ncbi:hypothetical protein EQ836_17665 [Ectopseudomonas mendocina]|uniref:CDP-Glycerol:Poly(Glycerophosphate) glycerophosphotransferase n=2 Tax=Ectopseudomonas TaxID=3236654 RepID=A0AA42IJ32_9GAMM|nr:MULTISPECIES: hypothetical protein [Pseudomonas]MDH0700751.1 hypothetical protein [Pseudomonas toyotomiensis]TRO12868.1 hypothetical protein EQ829_13320 [Pseudomonas mendocina]TRO15725.1 hypothetical protein EQ836_17665 [Pseudomonas mendocina]TRO42101.1 hypothetical protein EQ832_03530 [Pseudomonas sp. ALS1131]